MTQTVTPDAGRQDAATRPVRRLGVGGVFVIGTTAAVLLAAVHLTQGTSSVDTGDLLRLLTGGGAGETDAAAVLVASRLPRLLAAVLVGVALGIAGAVLQSLARNPLASPDTLGVNAGAYLAVTIAASFGLSLGVLPSGGIAFAGGLAAAVLVLALSSAGAAGPARLILAGSAIALALGSLTTLLLLLFQTETAGIFAWGAGTLVQTDLDAVGQMTPVVALGIIAAMLLATRLDVLALGDDTASVLGVPVRRTRIAATMAAVMLAAAAVTIAGPIGFVGLVAPVAVRLIAPAVPGLLRHRVLLPAAGLAGVLVVIGSDVLLRMALGGQAGVDVPTGIVTMLVGATVLVWLARRLGTGGPAERPAKAATRLRGRAAFVTVTAVLAVMLAGALVLAILAGDTWVLLGDVVNWLTGRSGRAVTFVLDQRLPRVGAAALAGAALAVAGTAVQAVCRNPLAEPGLLGITGGAGVGAILVITLAPTVGIWWLTAAAAAGALVAFALVYLISWRGGLSSDRLVLVGIGVWSGGTALITFIIIYTDPWNLALTWLSGSTYGRTLPQLIPVALALLLVTPLVARHRRDLDLLALDDDVPRVLGVRLERTRLLVLAGSALLTAAAVSAIGVVGFVGLVAPHAARALVGGRHARVLPVAILLGALLVSLADTLGRTAIAPAQVPAGLVTALLGTPYFVWLLWRSRA